MKGVGRGWEIPNGESGGRVDKVRMVRWSGKAGLGDLAVKWRWAGLWCALVAAACAAMWGAGQGASQDAKASSLAAQAARASVSGPAEASALAGMMTPEALGKAMADRGASGLDAALSSSSAKVAANAWTAKSRAEGDVWREWGFATAEVSAAGGATARWAGAWRAKVERTSQGLRVSELAMASLPEGAQLDPKMLDETSAPWSPGLRLDRTLAPGPR